MMKIRVSNKTKKIIAVYLLLLVTLYLALFVIPDVTDAFETTQILENGSIEVSCETTGYVVKDEAVCYADKTGTMTYNLDEGTLVKNGTQIATIEETTAKSEKKPEKDKKYSEYIRRLKKHELTGNGCTAPISGVFSTSIDGYEKYFSIDNLEKIRKEKTEKLTLSQLELSRSNVVEGEPIFKISSDDNWYIVCWLEKEDALKFEIDNKVRITLPASTVDARVFNNVKEGEYYRVIFYLNVYYEEFASARMMDMKVVQSNTEGLLVDNECIISKDGVTGVYVRTKDGDTYFAPVKIKASDDSQSVLYDGIFVNEEYEQVETVSVYQEVLRDPAKALEDDMKKETQEEK